MSVEPRESVFSGNKAWRLLAKLCGWNIPDEKSPLLKDKNGVGDIGLIY